jgi:hypothetical protein
MHRKYWVKQVRKTDSLRFGHQSKQSPVAVKAPWSALLNYFEAAFIVSVQQLVCYLS